ncbi:ribonuclease E activity regulator RraA [uncultured Ruegeria sp.]|uniref:ribonuclease E activity regulator RraA n=1 Tax=uncultured Ruegeria sp. TaxID=259304 RepID=UPI002633BD26|nr:ribonuclease E activity regulator RraA [uncultured Ruegeria sp.]
MKTADLIDHHASEPTLVHLPFRQFGTKPFFAAQIQTLKCFEDNTELRAQLETPGEGRVLVVDGGAPTRIAILGDMLADLAIQNGWAGLTLNAAIRDSAEINQMDTLVFALATSPVKSEKRGWGVIGEPVTFGRVKSHPGDWVYGDADGVLHSKKRLV